MFLSQNTKIREALESDIKELEELFVITKQHNKLLLGKIEN